VLRTEQAKFDSAEIAMLKKKCDALILQKEILGEMNSNLVIQRDTIKGNFDRLNKVIEEQHKTITLYNDSFDEYRGRQKWITGSTGLLLVTILTLLIIK